MRKTLALLTLLAIPALSQSLPQAGRTYESRSLDLNGDGKPEKVVLVAYKIDREEETWWGRLKVVSPSGQTLWAAPEAKSVTHPFAFGVWPFGASGLEWLGDIDGDGKIELLSPAPQSDVRPTTYRRYRWTGSSFQALEPRMLLEAPPGSGSFHWSAPVEWDGASALTWVSSLSGSTASITAEVTSWSQQGTLAGGRATMAPRSQGLQVSHWQQPLKSQ